jgi:bacteriocin biosynthesis cyclodehydratase domain-containing protein
MDAKLRERYSRQILFEPIGEQGQERLGRSRVTIIGCGALGSNLATLLARAGVGRLRIIDRDFVEPSNLQRQTLFEESDAQEMLPKAVAAERRLRRINSDVEVHGTVADLTPRNAQELLGDSELLLDGTDNFETRLLINDYAVEKSVPWVYAAVVSGHGLVMPIRPGETACLACIAEENDGVRNGCALQANEPTCDTVGVIGPAAGAIASLQAAAALKLLLGKFESRESRLVTLDVWALRFQSLQVHPRPDCRACGERRFSYLDGEAQPHITMCGRDSVQIHERRRQLDLGALGRKLASGGAQVQQNGFLLRLHVTPYELTVFADGRAIVKGTRDASVARSIYSRFVGA